MDDGTAGLPVRRIAVVFTLTTVLFGGGTFLTELLGEVPPDIDAKPFGLVYLVLAVVPFGTATVAGSVGAATGEGFLDISEGIEPDDPFGFLGYVVAFALFAWLLHRVGPAPSDRRWQLLAATVAGGVQATFEAVGFLLLGDGDALTVVLTVTGNAVAHGVIFGGLLLVAGYPTVRRHLAESTTC